MANESDSLSILEAQAMSSAAVSLSDYHSDDDDIEKAWNGPFTFVLGADPQFGMIDICKLKKTNNPTWKPEMKLTREIIERVNGMNPKPRFFIICGDMLDALPFEKDEIFHYNNNDIQIRDRQYTDFIKLFSEQLDPEIKLIFACGNHDVGDIPTPSSLAKYRNDFGDDYYTFWVGGVKFVVLNSQYFFSPDAIPEETEKHLQWMDENIADETAKFIVVFQHIPFFGESPEEDTIYCNIPKERRLVLLEKLRQAGVQYVFCGHYHKNAGGKYKNMEQVVTAAMGAPFGEDPSGFRVIRVGNFDITHEYVKIRETTDCSEFGQEETDSVQLKNISEDEQNKNDTASVSDIISNKDDVKSVTASEKMRRRNWLWFCCGANVAVEDSETQQVAAGVEETNSVSQQTSVGSPVEETQSEIAASISVTA